MARLGFLYPGHAAEDDYPLLAKLIGASISAEVVHTGMGLDAHEREALLEIGSSERLLEGARELRQRGVDAAMWACTSGSFVFGPGGARRQVAELAGFLGVPTSSTSWAFVQAIRAVGARRVAIAATYPEDIARAFETFLAAAGIGVASVGSQGIVTAAEVGTLVRERVLEFVQAGDHPEAEAVLVPDTALHTAAWLTDLEDTVAKPVLTANQVTMWGALGLAGVSGVTDGLGRLFGIDPTI